MANAQKNAKINSLMSIQIKNEKLSYFFNGKNWSTTTLREKYLSYVAEFSNTKFHS